MYIQSCSVGEKQNITCSTYSTYVLSFSTGCSTLNREYTGAFIINSVLPVNNASQFPPGRSLSTKATMRQHAYIACIAETVRIETTIVKL